LIPGTDLTGDTFESNPKLADELKSEGVEEIVVFGLQSECCIGATSDGALNAGFKVKLLSGAHSTYDDNGKTAAHIEKEVEEELLGKGAEIIPWEKWDP
jgi:nicotinamidase-related amidase